MADPSPTPSNPDDLALVRAALAREPAAVAALAERMRCIERFVARIRRRSRPAPGAPELADLVQEATLAILESLPRYEGKGPLEAWAHRVCTYTVWRALRRHRPDLSLDHDPIDAEAEDDETLLDQVHGLLQHLGGPEAEVVRMRHFDGLEFAEISERIGMPLATVRSHYYRALDRLRRRFGDRPSE